MSTMSPVCIVIVVTIIVNGTATNSNNYNDNTACKPAAGAVRGVRTATAGAPSGSDFMRRAAHDAGERRRIKIPTSRYALAI